jgi:hypothetical protein
MARFSFFDKASPIMAKGFDKATDLQENPDFQTVRGEPDFQSILDTLKKK